MSGSELGGRCHCGNVQVAFSSSKAIEKLGVRLCGCSFCTRQGARYISDPKGSLRITLESEADLMRYRFAHETADFLICRRCGVYIGAAGEEGDRWYGALNLNCLDELDRFGPGKPMNYDGEEAEGRQSRQSKNWTPLTWG